MSNKPISPPTISPVDPVAKPVAATVNRWAFAALVGGNLALSLTAMVVRFADTGPVAAAFWRRAAP
jgi:hypothetical protein